MSTLIWVGPNCTQDVLDVAEKFETVILIEPLIECCELLKEKIGHFPSVSILNCACGETMGIQEFHTYNENGFSSSLGVVSVEAKERFNRVDWDKTSTREVTVVNLGELIDTLELGDIDQLIIDAQGMDLTILRTIKKHLQAGRIRMVKSEADNGFQHYDGLCNSLDDQVEFMQGCGFSPLLVSSSVKFHPDVIWERSNEVKAIEGLERVSSAACL